MANLEKAQDQVLENDQLNKIDAKDVKFNMENYETSDKVSETEKREYEKLNEEYESLKASLDEVDAEDAKLDWEVSNYLVFEVKKPYAYTISRGKCIYIHNPASDSGSVEFYPYKWKNKRPVLVTSHTEYTTVLGKPVAPHTVEDSRTELSVDQYKKTLQNAKQLLNEAQAAVKVVKERKNKGTDDKINQIFGK